MPHRPARERPVWTPAVAISDGRILVNIYTITAMSRIIYYMDNEE